MLTIHRAFRFTVALLLVALAHAASVAQRAARVETVRFESRLVGKTLPYNVVLPLGYERGQTRYPVLYLLHGFSGHYDNWVSKTKLAEYAAQYPLIVVTPEGNDGWYTDSARAPADRYESYIVKELLPDVARRYRTVETRAARAVAGLSMGGYGALKFGVKYPETFALAASMSGAVGVASWRDESDLHFSPALKKSILDTFGGASGATKRDNDLFRLVREMPPARAAALPFLYLDCGTEDPLQLLEPNHSLADLLVERKIPHEYRQLPGRHDWVYWDQQVQEILRIAARRLSPPAPR
jgi:S-formylglutathione hydrolase FrmB